MLAYFKDKFIHVQVAKVVTRGRHSISKAPLSLGAEQRQVTVKKVG